MLRPLMLFGLVALFGCNQDSQKAAKTDPAPKSDAPKASVKTAATDAPKTPKAPPARAKVVGTTLWAGIDLASEAKHMQGKWNVKMSFGKPSVWVVKGNTVEITGADGKVATGTLTFQFPGRLLIKQDGMTRNMSYTRNGTDLYAGLGKAGMKHNDLYVVSAGRGIVRFDGKTCGHYEKELSFGNAPTQFSGPDPVTCRVEGSTFHYQVPKRGDATQFKDKKITIVGNALVNTQMKGNLLTPAK